MAVVAGRLQSRPARDFAEDTTTFRPAAVPAPTVQEASAQEASLQEAPVHCGRPMALADPSLQLPILTFPVEEPRRGRREWLCDCGFRQDPSPGPAAALQRVWLAAAQAEDRRWALDRAAENLNTAIRTAVADGHCPEQVAYAAGLALGEVRQALGQAPDSNAA